MYVVKFITIVLVVIIQCIIAIGIHEVGHILLAVKEEWHFFYMIMGPVGIKHIPTGGNRFFLEKKMSRWGGAAAVAKVAFNEVGRNELFKVVVAGPVFSLFFGMVSLLVGYLTGVLYWYSLGVISLIIGIITLIPHRVGYSYSDGGKMKSLLSEKKEVDLALARYRIGASILIGGGYKGIQYGDCRLLLESTNIRDQYMGAYNAYRLHQENGAMGLVAEYRQILNEMSGEIPKHMIKRI